MARHQPFSALPKLDKLALHLSLQESYCLPVLTYAAAAISLSVRQEKELNACWNSVYRKLFGFHKWEFVKYCRPTHGLNRLDLHSIIRLRRASFYRHIMLSASPLLCNIFGVFSFIHSLMMTFYLYLGRIAMWYPTFGTIVELMPVCVLVSFKVMLM